MPLHRVLVVDDEPELARASRELVEALGHACIAATDAETALRLATTFKPDVALLDLRLTDSSGYELARRLRENYDRLFLAAITGWELEQAKSLEAGFDRHVMKPVTRDVIQQLLDDAARE